MNVCLFCCSLYLGYYCDYGGVQNDTTCAGLACYRYLHKFLASIVVVVYQLPWPLLVMESDLPACNPPASFSIHLASSAVTPVRFFHKSKADNVMRMWVQLKRLCVLCMWMLQRSIVVVDVIWRLLWVSMIWGSVMYSFWVGKVCDKWDGEGTYRWSLLDGVPCYEH